MVLYPFSLAQLLTSGHFRRRTALYLGEKTIPALMAYYYGATHMLYPYQIDSPDLGLLDGFHDWVATHYGWCESTVGWSNIILQECDGDQSRAVDTFFALYDRFREEKKGG